MDPDALSAPGRALQRLGNAIGDLGGAFEGMDEPSDSDKLTAQLAALDADNESEKYFTEREAALTPDADPDQWHQETTKGIDGIWQRHRERISPNPKIQQNYDVNSRRFVGRYDVEAHRKATNVKVKRGAAAALETFKSTLQRVDPTTPEGKAVYDTVGEQLKRVPGLDAERAKEFLAEQAIQSIEGKVAKDPVGAIEQIEGTSKAWDEELRLAPGEAPPAGPGPQSSRPPDPVNYLTAKLAPGYEQRVGDVKDLHPVTQDRLGAFLAAAEDAGHDIRVVSGYRSPERQKVLWENAVKKYGSPQAARRWVAPPGGSSHQSGEAVDLQFQDRGAGLGGRRTAAVEWAHANARKFGLHFPLGHEDWHIEPVEAREGGKRFGGKYAKADSLYAKFAGTGAPVSPDAPLSVAFKDFSKGRGSAPLKRVEVGILHDVSGDDPARKKVPTPENIKSYHITFDKNGVYLNVPLDRQAPHAADMNASSIGIAHIGYEGDKLDPKAIENGAQAVALASQKTGLPIDRFMTHPEAGAKATRTTGKDPNEASWKTAVIARAKEIVSSGRMALGGPGSNVETRATSEPAPRPMGERGFTSFYGVQKPGGTTTSNTASLEALADIVQKDRNAKIGDVATPEQINRVREIVGNDVDVSKMTVGSLQDVLGKVAPGTVPSAAVTEQGKIPSEAVQEQSQADAAPRGDNVIPGPKVADASGLTPAQFAEQQRQAQAQAKPGEVRAPQPQYRQTTIRTKILDKLRERMPKYIEQRSRALDVMVKRVEEMTVTGLALPDEESATIRDSILKYGSEEQRARYQFALQESEFRAKLRRGPPEQASQIASQMRANMMQNGGTPEMVKRVEAIESLAKDAGTRLGNDPYEYAAAAGVMRADGTPIQKTTIDPQNLTINDLKKRAEDSATIQQTYGSQYNTLFDPDEKKKLGQVLASGGETTVKMIGMMYEAFGEDMPRAIAELSPKNPEFVQAGYLFKMGGDPRAIEAIAETAERRADPNYKSSIKMDGAPEREVIADRVFKNSMSDMEPQLRDRILRAAEAIYESRAVGLTDKATFDEDLFEGAVRSAIGEKTEMRKGAGWGPFKGNEEEVTFGGVVQSVNNWGSSTDQYIILPPTIAQETWRDAFEMIDLGDLDRAGLARPVDGRGNPVPLKYILENGTFEQQDGAAKFAVYMDNDDGSKGYVFGGKVGEPLILDMEKLVPILRPRAPHLFSSGD